MSAKKLKEIYLRAAARVQRYGDGDDHGQRFSCNAVGVERSNAVTIYRRMMGFDDHLPDLFLREVQKDSNPNELRVWLLCMAAAAVEDFAW